MACLLLRHLWSLLLVVVAFGPVAIALAQSVTERQAETDRAYVRWLEERSMLFQAAEQAQSISGRGAQWRHAYGDPQPREAVQQASVWLLDYPGSVIPRPGKSVVATWGNPELWQVRPSRFQYQCL